MSGFEYHARTPTLVSPASRGRKEEGENLLAEN